MDDKQDVTGVWYGRYEVDLWDERNGFIAVLEESGGVVTGVITERGDDGAIWRALVNGRRDGNNFRFIKQYDGTSGQVHALDYAGQVDAEGLEVNGVWSQPYSSGRFTMEREKFSAEALEAEDEAELTVH